MKPESIDILRNPDSGTDEDLIFRENGGDAAPGPCLVAAQTGQVFPIHNGVPVFIKDSNPESKANLQFYQSIAPLYDLLHAVPAMRKGGEKKLREEFLQNVSISPGSRVLEVAVGTGANLRYLPREAQYFGLDFSWEMLRRCQRTIKNLNMDADLFLGDAENLPFKNAVFDVVLNVCAFRLFNNKAKAIGEMIRVAKPGADIYIVDQAQTKVPVDLVPGNCKVWVEESPGWKLYFLKITKPGGRNSMTRLL